MQAKERLYSTTDGRIVREGDPAGAFLVYAVGDQVGEDHTDQVSRLVRPTGVTSQAFHDADARDTLRVRQADPTRANIAATATALADDPTAPVLMHDRLATEVADEARERANRDEALEASSTTTNKRLYWNADRDALLPEGHPDGAFLAYAPGDKIRRGHLDMFESASDMDDDTEAVREESTTPSGEATSGVSAPAKAAKPVPAKATPPKAPASNS